MIRLWIIVFGIDVRILETGWETEYGVHQYCCQDWPVIWSETGNVAGKIAVILGLAIDLTSGKGVGCRVEHWHRRRGLASDSEQYRSRGCRPRRIPAASGSCCGRRRSPGIWTRGTGPPPRCSTSGATGPPRTPAPPTPPPGTPALSHPEG